MSNRKAIPLKIQLAAALLQLVDEKGERLVSHEHAKLMSAEQIISLYQRDHHPIRVADGGEDVHWNLTWRLRAEHKRKTATIDQPELAKQRRIRAREAEHIDTMMGKGTTDILNTIIGRTKPKRRILTMKHSDIARESDRRDRMLKRKITSRPFPKVRLEM